MISLPAWGQQARTIGKVYVDGRELEIIAHVEELNGVNSRLMPRSVNRDDVETDSYVCVCGRSAMGALISDCITSG